MEYLDLFSERKAIKYLNGLITKVHEADIYDVRLQNGRVEAYVENTSNSRYFPGEYVTILLIENPLGTSSCKVIGRGKKFNSRSTITEVVV